MLFHKVDQTKKIRTFLRFVSLKNGGRRGIRTPGSFHFNGFQDRRIRPLCHLSGSVAICDCKVNHCFWIVQYFDALCGVFFD